MHVLLDTLTRTRFDAVGYLIFSNGQKEVPARITIQQLITGRIYFEIYINEKDWSPLPYRSLNRSSLKFSGELEDGSNITAIGLSIENKTIKGETWDVSLEGYIYNPGFIEVTIRSETSGPFSEIVCELINLPLLGKGDVQFTINQTKITISEIDQYKTVRKIMSLLKCTGILSEMKVPLKMLQKEEPQEFISLLVSLISLSQRTYVWCTSQIFKDKSGNVTKKRFQEPVFYYFRTTRPLISVDHLDKFLENTWNLYNEKYKVWHLGLAQDYYLHAITLNSVWPQSIGFFTALETLKQAYLDQEYQKNIEYYVSEGSFRSHKISRKVLDILHHEFPEFANLIETEKDTQEIRENKKMEIQTLKSKVGELNRRAYKLLLKNMFKQIKLSVSDEELNSLVKLRNDIIHRGTPRDKSNQNIYKESYMFGSLVEKVILALLEYSGERELYHEGVSFE